MNSTIGIILLAAGSSSRLGQSKQLLVVDEMPLLRKSVTCAIDAAIGNIIVVLGSRAQEHRSIVQDLNVEFVLNPSWQNGMGSSMKAGLNHLRSHQKNYEGAIIMVCDQPAVTSEHLKKLVASHHEQPEKIISSSYGQTLGVPALFPKSYFSKLQSLDDREGARKIIQSEKDQVVAIPLADGEIDIDTMEDYDKWIAKNN